MRDARHLTRRRWLAVCGGTISVGTAGCLGGGGDSADGADGGDGDSGDGDTSGSDGVDDQPEIRGERVVSETVTENSEWRYDLEKGDTITGVFEGEGMSSANIYRGESVAMMDSTSISAESTSFVQYTAEETRMYRVAIQVGESVHIEIYIDRA